MPLGSSTLKNIRAHGRCRPLPFVVVARPQSNKFQMKYPVLPVDFMYDTVSHIFNMELCGGKIYI